MTANELARKINRREYLKELTEDERKEAASAGLVIVFGYSDDNMEFRGAIDDEVGCFDGGTTYITKDGVLQEPDCCESDCPYFALAKKQSTPITAVWHDQGNPSWTFETEIPHSTFSVFDDGQLFCEGIVFSIDDVQSAFQ